MLNPKPLINPIVVSIEGLRVQGLGFRVQDLGLWVPGLGRPNPKGGCGLWAQGYGVRLQDLSV